MRSTRSGRIAACTALALAAGMILSGPVSAAEKPAPAPKAERPAGNERATGTRPTAPVAPKAKTDGQQRTAAGVAGVAAGAPVAPLFDVDGDGYSDILYRGLSGTSYLKTFNDTQDPEYYVEGAGNGEDFKDVIQAGNLNHDGGPELLTLSVSGKLSLLTAGKTGALRTGWSGNGFNIYNKLTAVGDVTGDGNDDLLARTPSGAMYLYPGNGTAGSGSPYGDRISLGGGWDIYSQLVGGGDFNDDGKRDLVAVTPDGVMYVYPGNGSGGFGDRIKSSTGWNMYNQLQVFTAAKGGSWLVGRDPSGKMWTYMSNGAGGFADRNAMGTGWQYTNLFSGQGGVPAHGRSELAGRTAGGAVYAYYGKMDGGFSDPQSVLTDGEAPLDQVGMTLASSFGPENSAAWLFFGGGKLFINNNDLGYGWDAFNSLSGVGDIDGDGYGDLLARGNDGVMWLYPGNGSGTSFRDRVRLGAGWNTYNKLFGAGDVTGDGRADLIARGNDGTLWVYPGNGTRGFGDRVQIGYGWNGLTKLTAVGDITGDGRTDVVGVNSAGTAFVYKATGLKGMNTFADPTNIGGGWNMFAELH